MDSKSAKEVTEVTIELLMPFKYNVHTVRSDNGWEFVYHSGIAEVLELQIFLLIHMALGEWGNENCSFIIRRYQQRHRFNKFYRRGNALRDDMSK